MQLASAFKGPKAGFSEILCSLIQDDRGLLAWSCMTQPRGGFSTHLNGTGSMKPSYKISSVQLQPLSGQETMHLNILLPSVRVVVLIWGLPVHTSNTTAARNSHWFMSHYNGCPINTHKKNPKPNPHTCLPVHRVLQHFPFYCTYHCTMSPAHY